MSALPSRFRPHPETVAARLGDEIVLVHLGTDRIHQLNRTAARLWELLCEGRDRGAIQRRLLEEFEVTEAQVTAEIDDWLRTLQAEQLICPDSEKPA